METITASKMVYRPYSFVTPDMINVELAILCESVGAQLIHYLSSNSPAVVTASIDIQDAPFPTSKIVGDTSKLVSVSAHITPFTEVT